VDVEFAPASAGTQSGSLTVSSSALSTGAFVSLYGMGFDFALAPTGSASQTIASGQTAYYTLVITPLNNSRGAFTFQCGSLPPHTSCTFNPSSEAINANTTGNVVVEIATGLTTTTARATRPPAWPALPLACGLALLPLALVRRHRVLLLIALLAILTGGVSSCTQSSVGGLPTPPSPTTPGITAAATYTIPVTVTSIGVSHSVTLTMTVD
jgi:hypothetical protein